MWGNVESSNVFAYFGCKTLLSVLAKLSQEHKEKVVQYEKVFEMKQKERQETFGKAFEEDLETYKQTGKIPIISKFPTMLIFMLLEELTCRGPPGTNVGR